MNPSDPPTEPISTRTALARALVLAALGALALGVFVEAGGEFQAQLVATRISARSGIPALVVAVLALAGALALSRGNARRESDAAVEIGARHAWLGAVLIALVVFVTGVRLGSTVAAGADSSGYISQAALWRTGSIRTRVPLLLRSPWPNAAWTLSPLGYRPGTLPDDIVPSYPPGLPLQLAAATAIFNGEEALALVVPGLGALAVWMTFLAGRRLAGGGAGLAAAALLAASPTFLRQVIQPMSDVPVTAWWLVAVVLATRGAGAWALLAGVASGIAVLTRPNLVPLLGVVLVMLWPRGLAARRIREWSTRVGLLAAGVVPAVFFLGWYNTTLYGAPWVSGYGDAAQLFSRANISTNLAHYTDWLVDTHAALLALALAGLLAAVVWPALPGRRRGALECLALVALVSACYLPYAVFTDATYLRFFLPAIAGLAVLGGLGIVSVLSLSPGTSRAALVPAALRAAVGVALIAGVAGLGAGEARARGVHEFSRHELRYQLVADWVRAHTSPDDLVLAAQHSGSIWHRSHRRVVRWDLLDPGDDGEKTKRRPTCANPRTPAEVLPTTWLEHVASYGVSSLVVVEAGEEAAFRARFGASSRCGLLDWPPYATTDPPSTVRIYRFGDRVRHLTGESWVPIRIAGASN